MTTVESEMEVALESAELNPRPSPSSQTYLLGHGETEEQRLKKQAEELRQESESLFDRIGLEPGGRALDLGCGPQGVLDLLSERVGPSGHVIGVERNLESVATAKRFVLDRGLANVQV